ncbi:Transmembrane 9 superfamily member 3 [Amphibalanus amphitrite]|uniref:Transmembrane 9 superfamily member n=1 Tax=Amphibalanus amphitrite TaxID=1232801 RepID=A0A6A4WI86_AMPAM|nr:Transmembrane 9 superfamily member 3 [Amphibalanus amphitrite]
MVDVKQTLVGGSVVNQPKETYCQIELDEEGLAAFRYAADEDGEYLWTHKRLDIGVNDGSIVDVNLTSEAKFKLHVGAKIPLTYEVVWKKSPVKFEDRFDKYLDPSFFQHRIHWFSIFNSFMMVIFLVGLVSMILMRTLKKDYQRYSKDEEMDDV